MISTDREATQHISDDLALSDRSCRIGDLQQLARTHRQAQQQQARTALALLTHRRPHRHDGGSDDTGKRWPLSP